MNFFDIYDRTELWNVPFKLLEEREPRQNISHKAMPTWDEHCAFIRTKPYIAWYVFDALDGQPGGCVYLSKQRELGIGVLKAHRGQGLGEAALWEIMRRYPGRFLANVAPGNSESRLLFAKLGFTLVQQTYSREVT